MISQRRKLVEYFKKNISKGYNPEGLKWALISQGYTRTDVAIAIDIAKKEIEEQKKVEEEKPKIKYELYDVHNKLIRIKMRKPFSLKKFFRNLFS